MGKLYVHPIRRRIAWFDIGRALNGLCSFIRYFERRKNSSFAILFYEPVSDNISKGPQII